MFWLHFIINVFKFKNSFNRKLSKNEGGRMTWVDEDANIVFPFD